MVLFRARDLDAPAKKRARCFDWQRPGIREAYELSVVSLVASGVAVIMGAVSTGQTDSATALGYTLENCVDFLGSVLVLWRFSGGGDGVRVRLRADLGRNTSARRARLSALCEARGGVSSRDLGGVMSRFASSRASASSRLSASSSSSA